MPSSRRVAVPVAAEPTVGVTVSTIVSPLSKGVSLTIGSRTKASPSPAERLIVPLVYVVQFVPLVVHSIVDV